MAIGYSFRLRDMNNEAPSDLLGVKLGRICIERGVPVADIAERMGVSRQTVYNWFSGETSPQDADTIALIEQFLEELN